MKKIRILMINALCVEKLSLKQTINFNLLLGKTLIEKLMQKVLNMEGFVII